MAYWRSGRFFLENYATRVRVEARPLVCELLGFFSTWRSAADLVHTRRDISARFLRQLIAALVRHTILQRAGRPAAAETLLETWAPWNPAAGFFHFTTKDVTFVDVARGERALRRKAASHQRPPLLKRYPRATLVALPAAAAAGEFAGVLLGRRTWRRFGTRPLDLSALATLLRMTGGVQSWVALRGEGHVAFKTSPSAGARHPLELYVLARNVSGLPRGLYHYGAADHVLARLGTRRAPPIDCYLPRQAWYRDASALVLVTAVVARSMWRYDYPRAYRSLLIEAGHLCQTFSLVATWLGLAPFESMALADSRVERDLNLDGVTESVLYAFGVGTRPRVSSRPPWPAHEPGRIKRA